MKNTFKIIITFGLIGVVLFVSISIYLITIGSLGGWIAFPLLIAILSYSAFVQLSRLEGGRISFLRSVVVGSILSSMIALTVVIMSLCYNGFKIEFATSVQYFVPTLLGGTIISTVTAGLFAFVRRNQKVMEGRLW